VLYERITVDPDVMSGLPCIRGLRIPAASVVAMVADGMSSDEIVAEMPDLVCEDIAEALRYAAPLSLGAGTFTAQTSVNSWSTGAYRAARCTLHVRACELSCSAPHGDRPDSGSRT
jgi:uncharacterized protein (DUF433 family)